jgi:hypothetical protein
MTIARSANIRAMLDAREDASDAHKYAVDEAVKALTDKLYKMGFTLPADDRLAEVEGVVSNFLMEAGYR